ncbi:hypothetical protein GE21DRAFT_1310708 [Neurospora crassa]|nr:hypothetical protein GE21DRAFT_1310708 [Neurospora crassa]
MAIAPAWSALSTWLAGCWPQLQRTGHPQSSLAVKGPEKGSMIADVCVFPFHHERNRKLGQGRTLTFGREVVGHLPPLSFVVLMASRPDVTSRQDGRIMTPWSHMQLVRSSTGSDKTAFRTMSTSFLWLTRPKIHPHQCHIHLRLSTFPKKKNPYRQMSAIHAGSTQASMSARGFHFGKHPEAVPPMMVCNERGRIVASNTVLGD